MSLPEERQTHSPLPIQEKADDNTQNTMDWSLVRVHGKGSEYHGDFKEAAENRGTL
ncbi:hypothetical protein IWW55_002529, partial [Coemansia sp. RSA 2706]